MRARVGGVPCTHGTWGKHLHLPRAVSARSVHALGRTPPQSKARNQKAEAIPPTILMKTRRGVVRWADSVGTRRSPSWGEDSFLSPNKSRPELPSRREGVRGTGGTKEQGVRSPSGNSPRRMPRVNLP